jgi:anti-sigma factor RsiW
MHSILQQLDNDEAILLMYLADELPPQDRAAVEARLAAEEALMSQLHNLRAMHESIGQSLTELDASQPILSKAVATQRKLQRLIRQWQAEPHPESMHIRKRAPRNHAWLYPVAAAAVLVIGLITWWGAVPADIPAPQEIYSPYVSEAEFQKAQAYVPLETDYLALQRDKMELDAAADLRVFTQ